MQMTHVVHKTQCNTICYDDDFDISTFALIILAKGRKIMDSENDVATYSCNEYKNINSKENVFV